MLDRMPCLVPHDPHALGARCPFDIEDLVALESAEPRMGEIERHGEAGHSAGREPLVREPHVRLEYQPAHVELLVQLRDAPFQPRPLDGHTQVLEPDLEESIVAVTFPGETVHVVAKKGNGEQGTENGENAACGAAAPQAPALAWVWPPRLVLLPCLRSFSPRPTSASCSTAMASCAPCARRSLLTRLAGRSPPSARDPRSRVPVAGRSWSSSPA